MTGCNFDIAEIAQIIRLPTIEVVVGIIAYGMAFGQHAFKNFGVRYDVFTDAKKGGLGFELGELIEDKRRYFGVRTIVEGEVHAVGGLVDMPNALIVQCF